MKCGVIEVAEKIVITVQQGFFAFDAVRAL